MMDPVSAVGVVAAAAQCLGIALKTIRFCYQIRDSAESATDRNKELERAAEERHQSNIQRKLEEEFLSSLLFNEMNDRLLSVKGAAPNTLEWLFYDPDSDGGLSVKASSQKIPKRYHRWANFHQWLRTDSSLYWICGKIGSGKSTLMVHIIQDRRTRKGLDIWKGQARLHVFQFFFWRPGSELQKSILGLLRSLLYHSGSPQCLLNLCRSSMTV
ncbi:hypothetical protein PG997_000614 [Apiospora hydei]|uniref:Nephrocystin 3-like N-terminal domain-containing protein n=1 Tax=Apiospora hydei TaxID=1337664 RepID=A0ABR1XBC7_9PEZI